MNSKADLFMREISIDNIQIIHSLAQQIWPASFKDILSKDQISYMMEMMYSVDVLTKELERGVEFYVLELNSLPVGYTAIEKKDDTAYKLHKIYLSHQLRGKGLGKYQLQSMEQIVKNYGAQYLYLNVNRYNKAVDFYKSQGYEITSEEDIDIGNHYFMNDYVMKKMLV